MRYILGMKKFLFIVLIAVFFSCVSSSKFIIDDTMASPIVDEVFAEMEVAISENWTKKKTKPAIIVNFCFDERFGTQTVTVISDWIQGRLIENFVNSRHYRVVDNDDIERIRNEKKFQKAGYVDDKIMVDEGRELGGQYMIMSKISKYSLFEAKIIDIEKAELIYSTSKIFKQGTKIGK